MRKIIQKYAWHAKRKYKGTLKVNLFMIFLNLKVSGREPIMSVFDFDITRPALKGANAVAAAARERTTSTTENI